VRENGHIKPTPVTSGVAQQGLRGYWTSPHPSPGIPGTPASCWGRRESHFGSMLVFVPVSNTAVTVQRVVSSNRDLTIPQAVNLLAKSQSFVPQKITNKQILVHLNHKK
jgi:hypothetical protein